MPYLTIENFKFGLDTRRGELTSQAGVLTVCENGHINQGGEIDKRKAFVPLTAVGSYTILDTNGDQGLWGLEATSIGLVVFGNSFPFGSALVNHSQPTLVSAVPAGVTYVQVQHPVIWQAHGVTYDRTKHRVTKVVFSQSPSGLPFVCVKYADSAYVLYYDWTIKSGDGTATTYYLASLIAESQNGVVFTPLVDDSNLSQELRRQINTLVGWRAVQGTPKSNISPNGFNNIFSPVGLSFSPVVSYDASNGNRISTTAKETSIDAVPNIPSVASFILNSVGVSDRITITAFSDVAGSTSITLLSGFGIGSLSTKDAAAAIVEGINIQTSATGYSAVAKGTDGTVAVFAPAALGLVTFNLTVTITGTGTQSAGGAFGKPLAVLVSSQSVLGKVDNTQNTVISPVVTVYPQGGTTPTYSFAWQAIDNPADIIITSLNTADTTFKTQLPKNTQVLGTFKCAVTSGSVQVASPNITVRLTRGFVITTKPLLVS